MTLRAGTPEDPIIIGAMGTQDYREDYIKLAHDLEKRTSIVLGILFVGVLVVVVGLIIAILTGGI